MKSSGVVGRDGDMSRPFNRPVTAESSPVLCSDILLLGSSILQGNALLLVSMQIYKICEMILLLVGAASRGTGAPETIAP
jgi:hypothetical protein